MAPSVGCCMEVCSSFDGGYRRWGEKMELRLVSRVEGWYGVSIKQLASEEILKISIQSRSSEL